MSRIYRDKVVSRFCMMLQSWAVQSGTTDEEQYAFLLHALFNSMYIFAKRSSMTFKFSKQETQLYDCTGKPTPAWLWRVTVLLPKKAWMINRTKVPLPKKAWKIYRSKKETNE